MQEKKETTQGFAASQQPGSHLEQSDPQLTELKGFVDQTENLEPTLTDGTKVSDENHVNNMGESP